MTDVPQEQLFSGLFGDKGKQDRQDSITSPQTQSQPTPQSSDSAPHLNPRSCVTCRKRKVRCDKHEPCGNCTKAGIDCVFPAPGRAPRKPRKPLDAELLKRLKRLEGVVQSLGAQVDEPTGSTSTDAVTARSPTTSQHPLASTDSVQSVPAIGKLVINHDRSRYVNNAYWAGLQNEIEDLRDILDQSSGEEELEIASPDHPNDHESSTLHGFLFGFSSLAVDMKKLYPSPSQIFIIWEVFKENIDPVVKVLHCPSVKNLILKAAVNTDNLSRQSECLFFAICFGSVVSMGSEQCVSLLGDTKPNLWKKYRFAAEQALARANFLNSSSLMVLQSLIFYLICLRYVDDSKSVWALGGLAIHQAYTLGLHRDGTHFGLEPFETEMRRRLWWHINILDVRAAEDHGTDLRTTTSTYDTQLPCNINDEDIWPGMREAPTPHEGTTEMTFCLVRFELSNMTRRLNLLNAPQTQQMTLEEIEAKEKEIDACHKSIDEKYFRHCNMSIPIYWVAATVGRLILAKMWLKIHHPRLTGTGLYEHPEIRERVFLTSIEVVEFGHLLEINENTARWAWLFRTYMQWHAFAHVLSELAVRSPGPDTDRAWRAIEAIYEESEHAKRQRGMLWKPIRQLMTKARAHREKLAQAKPGQDPAAVDGYIYGERSVVAATADALGLDFQETQLLPASINGMNGVPGMVGMSAMGGMGGMSEGNDANLSASLSPPDHLQNTPDIMNWDDWDSNMIGTQPMYPLSFDTTKQEWF